MPALRGAACRTSCCWRFALDYTVFLRGGLFLRRLVHCAWRAGRLLYHRYRLGIATALFAHARRLGGSAASGWFRAFGCVVPCPHALCAPPPPPLTAGWDDALWRRETQVCWCASYSALNWARRFVLRVLPARGITPYRACYCQQYIAVPPALPSAALSLAR